ncbi:hypothetical protein INT45_002762 [Circinella minor]|uniref:Zn(2)-C6 fungal-type domain-containing protein n=1 Tax=Circinella minor TaxID=1195481 RepID=A0A8H7VJ00_9FUNG|nr:hypothetical protein INT45_002762 [Circinella minor]
MSQSSRIPGSTASKKVRMTMACERCRSKKVKCDFAHPSCSRCQQAKAKCSYDGSATQVDLFNLVKLNETVDMLQQRVRSIESDLKDVSTNTQFVADEFRMTRSSATAERGSPNATTTSPAPAATTTTTTATTTIASAPTTTTEPPVINVPKNNNMNTNFAAMNSLFASSASSNGNWSLSLTPRGLRIDTNIISLHDLYDILLTGVSRIDLDGDNNKSSTPNTTDIINTSGSNHQRVASHSKESDTSSTSTKSTTPVPEIDRTTIERKNDLWKTKLKTFPLYSTWEPDLSAGDYCKGHTHNKKRNDTNNSESTTSFTPEMMSQETYDELMDIYSECLLCLPCADPDHSVADRYKKGTLDPFLFNTAMAWTARHAAIYHNLFPGQDPNAVGEHFFDKAKELLKERFTKTDIDTMHGLIIMYVYAIGRPGERRHSTQSESYIYLGLAIRMCLNMKMFQESTSPDPIMREKHRRFFWAIYFLETLGTIHSDKAFSLPSEDLITVSFPTVLEHEVGEKQWRVLFSSQRFRITRIYRNIIYKTSHEKPLLSSVSTLEKELHEYLDQLPSEFRYSPGDINTRDWTSTSFREQGCLKLNFEYNFQLCQLYSLFSSKSFDDEQTPSAIDLLTRERCRIAADNIVELLECFSRLNQRWCHFSLETAICASMMYNSMLLSKNTSQTTAWARQQLERMLHILSNSPIYKHKYVFAFTERINKLLVEQQSNINLDLDEDEQQHKQGPEHMDDTPIEDDEQIPRERLSSSSIPSPSQQSVATQQQQQQHHITTQHQHQQPELMQKMDMLDMPSEIFDLTKETTADPLHFLYAPSVMGLCSTTPSPHDSMIMSTTTPQPATPNTDGSTHGGFTTTNAPNYTSRASNSMTYYSSSTTTSSSPPYHMPLHPQHPMHPQHHPQQHHHHSQQQQQPQSHWHPNHHHHHHGGFNNFSTPDQSLQTQFVNMEGIPLQQHNQPQQNSKKRSNTDDFRYY